MNRALARAIASAPAIAALLALMGIAHLFIRHVPPLVGAIAEGVVRHG